LRFQQQAREVACAVHCTGHGGSPGGSPSNEACLLPPFTGEGAGVHGVTVYSTSILFSLIAEGSCAEVFGHRSFVVGQKVWQEMKTRLSNHIPGSQRTRKEKRRI
jgi:hypothetical protein